MARSESNPWLHRFAVLTALATLGLVVIGGLVTSHGVGMSVPDWPTSFGYNMFALPISTWVTGGVFHEHTHRLWATIVGVMVVTLTRWLGGRASRLPLIIVGVSEILVGQGLLRLGVEWKGAGHFLSGIGGVVLLAGIVWVRNDSASKPLPKLGWWAFVLVQLQGLLGGLRVVLDAHLVANVRMGTLFGIFHGCLAQLFLALLVVIAVLTNRWWLDTRESGPKSSFAPVIASPIRTLFLITTLLIFAQLILGATMRHQHAGLAIPDFPLAYGKVWPATDADAIATYNARRFEITASNPITAFQVVLQMVHRLMALTILVLVSIVAWKAPASLRKLGFIWLGLILVQVGLGAWTIWSNKAADVATLHVLVGALSLVTGVVSCLISFRRFARVSESADVPVSETSCAHHPPVAVNS